MERYAYVVVLRVIEFHIYNVHKSAEIRKLITQAKYKIKIKSDTRHRMYMKNDFNQQLTFSLLFSFCILRYMHIAKPSKTLI